MAGLVPERINTSGHSGCSSAERLAREPSSVDTAVHAGCRNSGGQEGDWRQCAACEWEFETEMYVWYGTNEYNFVKLKNPPKYEPTRCAKCKRMIRLAEDGYSMKAGGYYCMRCSGLDLTRL
jgi:hypothetical protein